MLRHFPLAAWITLSLALVAAGAWVRLDGTFEVADQFLLGMLFFVAGLMLTVALIGWLPLLRWLPDDRDAGRVVAAVVIAPAATMALITLLAFETDAAAAARHRASLLRLARIVAEDFERRGRMPVLFDDALHRSGTRLPNRGDADGRALSYQRLDPGSALLCAPECRVHVLIRGPAIIYQPWPDDEPDPCWTRAPSYWAGRSPAGHP